MKKLFLLLLSLTVLCAAVPALADLDAAFEADTLTLVEAEGVYTPAVSDFELTDDMLASLKSLAPDTDVAARLEDALAGKTVTALSMAPSGNAALLEADNAGVCEYEGKYHILYPSSTRGAGDPNGSLAAAFMRHAASFRGNIDRYNGVVWSPDGRYAAINNLEEMLIGRMKNIFDPAVIDLSTGEIFLVEASGAEPKKASAVTTGAFSPDGKYYYYVTYGGHDDAKIYLCRCDLATGETAVCLKSDERDFIQMLALADGSLLVMRDNATKANEQGTICRFAEKDGVWTTEVHESAATVRYASPFRLLYSERSGYAVVIQRTLLSLPCSFHLVRTEEGFEGLDRFLCLSEEKDEVVSLTAEEYMAEVNAASEKYSQLEDPKPVYPVQAELPFQVLQYSALSPDGNYLLVLGIAEDPHTLVNPRNLYVIRLSDLAVRKVAGLDGAAIPLGAASTYRPGIEWNTDTLVIDTVDGLKTFRFE